MPGRPLKVGIQLPEVEWEARWPDLRAMALRAEELGFDSIWCGDHLLYRRPGDDRARGPWEAWTLLAGLAAVTSRITLGPLVAATAFHAPAMLAKQAATVDEISGGRLVLGLGAGWNETEFAAFGFPFDRRISRFAEAFTIIRTLLRDGAIDFEGEFFTARDCELVPRPRPGGPPLMIGSTRAADAGDRGAARGRLERLVQRVREPAGGDRRRSATRWTPPRGRPGAIPPRSSGRWPCWSGCRAGAAACRATRRMTPSRRSRAPPAEIAATLRAFAAEGIAHVQLVVDPITLASLDALAPVLEDLDRG